MSSIVDDFKDVSGLWVKSFGNSRINKVQTMSYSKWLNIVNRCRVGGAFQKRCPTYVGCSLSETFSEFQGFTDWHVKQVGYGIAGYQIDKDILVRGNKVYSENNCVLVPSILNNFLLDRAGDRGKQPQGVSFNIAHNKYVAQISSEYKRKHLGYYNTCEAAQTAYKEAKQKEAYRWYERLKAGEFAVDERVIERMRALSHDDYNH